MTPKDFEMNNDTKYFGHITPPFIELPMRLHSPWYMGHTTCCMSKLTRLPSSIQKKPSSIQKKMR